MLSFTSRALAGGRLEYAITRKDNAQYLLILARSHGMAATREIAHLNYSTPAADSLSLSADNRPCLWLDTDLERDSRNLGPPGGVLAALLAAEPRVPIKPTGRTRMISAAQGGQREAVEIEILLSEDELAHCCYYCGAAENSWDGDVRFKQTGGEGYDSTYLCPNCARNSAVGKTFTRIWRTGRVW